MSKFILYLPYSRFIDLYEQKGSGALLIGFKEIGYNSQVIVGKMESSKFRRLGIKIYETNNLGEKYIVYDHSKMHIAKRIKNFFNIRELLSVLNILINERPEIFMSYDNSTLTGLIILIYKFYCRVFRINTLFILKLDSDGASIASISKGRKKLVYLYYGFLSFIFTRIITETTCGYGIFKNVPGMKARLRVVPNSVSDDFLARYEPTIRKKNIISVSRITPQKGLDILLKSFSNICHQHPEWNLEILGTITNRSYYEELIKLIEKLDIKEKVNFPGYFNREQLIKKYRTSSIFCLPSRHESFAISRLEALSQGMYVITTTAGCAEDFLSYGVHIVPIDNIELLADSLEEGITMIESGEFKPDINKKITSYSQIASIISSPDF